MKLGKILLFLILLLLLSACGSSRSILETLGPARLGGGDLGKQVLDSGDLLPWPFNLVVYATGGLMTLAGTIALRNRRRLSVEGRVEVSANGGTRPQKEEACPTSPPLP